MAGGLEHPIALIPEAIKAVGIHLPEPFGANHVVTTWAVMLFLFLIGFIASKNLTMVPGKLQNLFEVLIGGLEDFVVGNIGEEGRRVYPVLIGLFIFILTSNWCGLIPGVDAPTANVNTNAAMAIFLFSYYNIIGIMKWGPGYIKHFLGPIGFLAPLMLVLEIISHLARPLSLTLRLFGNIRGEEIVLILMFSLAPILGSLPMYFLFMLGKFIQAFIFFMLGMIYLKGSLEHAH